MAIQPAATFVGRSNSPICYVPFEQIWDGSGKLLQLEKIDLCNIPTPINIRTLCSAVSHGVDVHELRNCIEQYTKVDPETTDLLKEHGWPILFYAVAITEIKYLEFFLEYGLDPTKTSQSPGAAAMPLIAFTIINGSDTAADTSEIIARLLCASVNPKTIPEGMWADLPAELDALAMSDDRSWCTPDIRNRLKTSLTVTHCYLLLRASETDTENARTTQIAKGNTMAKLLEIGHSIVGQQPACMRVLDLVFAHIALKRPEPLLLAFAGPPGHGKTELAERIGDMISCETTTVNCAEIRTSWGLFGAESGHGGQSNGTTLNNFLVDNKGETSVVFLDEFDKSNQEVTMLFSASAKKVRLSLSPPMLPI
jgi:hypothetical protein